MVAPESLQRLRDLDLRMASTRREHGRYDDEVLHTEPDQLAHGFLKSRGTKLVVSDGEALAVQKRLELRGKRFEPGPIGIRCGRSRPVAEFPVQFHLLG